MFVSAKLEDSFGIETKSFFVLSAFNLCININYMDYGTLYENVIQDQLIVSFIDAAYARYSFKGA